MKKTSVAATLVGLMSVSCTTAGPFVTSISSDGRGNLIIEKSMVKMNSFMGTVSNEGTTTVTVKLFDLEELSRQGAPKPK